MATRKRTNGSGTVTWDESRQRWRVRVRVGTNLEGRPVFKQQYVTSQDEADQLRLDMLRQYRDAEITGATPTLHELAETWLHRVNERRAVSTQANVLSEVRRHIQGGPMAKMPVDRIRFADVESWYDTLAARRHSLDYVLTLRKHLGQILRFGIKRNHLTINPVDFAELPALKGPKPKATFTLEEAERFLEACRQDDEPWGPFYATMLLLGLRPGEACALRWSKIDWTAGTVHVDTALRRVDGGRPAELNRTKNSLTRTIRLAPEVIELLRLQQARQEIDRLVAGEEWPTKWEGLVFLGPEGEPCYSSNLRKQLDRICWAAGVKRITPYELRHSCASILLHRGVDITTTAVMLGTSERMLRRHYHHLVDPVISAGVDAWAGILNPT